MRRRIQSPTTGQNSQQVRVRELSRLSVRTGYSATTLTFFLRPHQLTSSAWFGANNTNFESEQELEAIGKYVFTLDF